ncbi:MAG: hypothetical protein AAF413_03500 [Patescibacteria group bacterium]
MRSRVLKYLLILILGFALTWGTYFVDSNQVVSFAREGTSCNETTELLCSVAIEQDADKRGFPFSFVEPDAASTVSSADNIVIDSVFSFANFIKSLGFWSLLLAVVSFFKNKVRDLLGNLAIMAIAGLLIASYLGLITFG